jgi:catechol 2,3-dioxygenase-like lactoylglutathione lyase family enzyme
MIGTFDVLVIDCPEPGRLADFYAELLGWRKVVDEPDWVEIMSAPDARPIIAFQQVKNYAPPEWPGQEHPQQMHVDVKVDDLDEGEAAVIAIGARPTGSGTDTFRVYLDPDDHPFCLIAPND